MERAAISSMNKAIRLTVILLEAAILLFAVGCVERHSTQLNPNKQPRTFFWLMPESTLASGISKQELHWWAEDQDGFVIGYLVAVVPDIATIPEPDTLSYVYTTKNDSLLSFPIRVSNQTFLVAVRAIDNSFNIQLPEGAFVKLSPEPFWDKNSNGVYDAGDVLLPLLLNSMDQQGAKECFPVKNSPPTIDYDVDLADPSVIAEPPKITFPVASFSWIGSDIDGDETIVSYRISLNDSTFSAPVVVSRSVTTVTLAVPRATLDGATGSTVTADVLIGSFPNLIKVGALSGLRLEDTNKVYVQAVDVAGDRSAPLRFPSKGRTWYVKKPHGKLLIVADYIGSGDSSAVRRYYMDSVFARITALQNDGYDYLNIRTDTTSTRALGSLVPALQHINPAFVKTLQLYDCVLWYTDAMPSLDVAQYSLYHYWSNGGHVIFTTKFTDPFNNHDPAKAFRDIVPIDTLAEVPLADSTGSAVTKFSGNIVPDSSLSEDVYPALCFKQRIAAGFCIYPIVKSAGARYLYYLPAKTGSDGYPQTPICVIDENKRVIFITLALERLSATYPVNGGVIKFFEKAFQDFGLYQ